MDMSDPKNPTLTARLLTPAMDTPHESLVVSQKRGLLAAVAGNLATNVGQIDIYDISKDCRQPELGPPRRWGSSGTRAACRPTGNTFYSASPSSQTIVAVDISNPTLPVPIWFGNYDSHGLSISADGNRAYIAGTELRADHPRHLRDPGRVPNPNVPVVARLQWKSMSIPQNAIPITVKGHPYLVEIDEFGAQSEVGAGRMIDIADERNPRVVSNLRLEVHQPENFPAQANDNGARTRCRATRPLLQRAHARGSRDRRVQHDPVRAARVRHPQPGAAAGDRVLQRTRDRRTIPGIGIVPAPSNWAMSSPSFVPERGEIWYSDGLSGFYAVRLTNGKQALCGAGRGRGVGAWRAARRSDRGTSAACASTTPWNDSNSCR